MSLVSIAFLNVALSSLSCFPMLLARSMRNGQQFKSGEAVTMGRL